MATPTTVLPHYPGISPKAYEHPSDRAATAALGSIPLLEKILKKISELRFERAYEQLLLANAVHLGERQLPAVWERHLECAGSIDLPVRPDLYLRQLSDMNALTVGSARPVIILNSGLVSGLPGAELTAVLAHEQGHVLSDHV